MDSTSTLDRYAQHLLPKYENYPRGHYASILLMRKTESETIFRTEGSGEGLSKETVMAGLRDQTPVRRVVISKRKQVAVERRTGRELLREHGLLKSSKGGPCALNTNAPCEHCIDCMLYGFAVGGGGAQKSRVLSDDAFSIGTAGQVADRRTFNAIFENGTMRNPDTGQAATSINEDEYVRPETHFLEIETLKDVTAGEFQYVLGNLLRSTRYGAISSRQGRLRNTVLAVVFSDCELFSNLELTQAVWDRVKADAEEPPFPLTDGAVRGAALAALGSLLPGIASRTPVVVGGEALEALVAETTALFREPERVGAWLRGIEAGYQ